MSMNNPYIASANPYDKYQSNTVATASKEELTLMLYEAALKFCNQAIIANESGNHGRVHELLVKVEKIIEEFECTLNFDYEISKSLFSVYDYVYRRTLEADNNKDKKIMTEIRDIMRDLRDTWKEAMRLAKEENEANS